VNRNGNCRTAALQERLDGLEADVAGLTDATGEIAAILRQLVVALTVFGTDDVEPALGRVVPIARRGASA
jgi:hypothetical protein